jgi:hypothetical protein
MLHEFGEWMLGMAEELGISRTPLREGNSAAPPRGRLTQSVQPGAVETMGLPVQAPAP